MFLFEKASPKNNYLYIYIAYSITPPNPKKQGITFTAPMTYSIQMIRFNFQGKVEKVTFFDSLQGSASLENQ